METTTTASFVSSLGSSDLGSFIIALEAYRSNAFMEPIQEYGIGMNDSSGNVYIALENGITIASCFNQPAVFSTYSGDSDEEHEFETYNQAEDYLSANNE